MSEDIQGMPNPFLPTQRQTTLLVWGLVAHVVADWLLQTDWMARHKNDLRHPAGWVHSGIHTFCQLWVMPWHLALLIGVSHLLIDTRIPLRWWMRVVKGVPPDSPVYKDLAIWMDQMLHVMALAAIVLLFA